MTPTPERIAAELKHFEAYYFATRPHMREIDPQLMRRVLAETLLSAHRRGKPSLLDAFQRAFAE